MCICGSHLDVTFCSGWEHDEQENSLAENLGAAPYSVGENWLDQRRGCAVTVKRFTCRRNVLQENGR
jgi:hypothetical protein